MVSMNDVMIEEGVNIMKLVYEYFVDVVGEDVDVGDFWMDYC